MCELQQGALVGARYPMVHCHIHATDLPGCSHCLVMDGSRPRSVRVVTSTAQLSEFCSMQRPIANRFHVVLVLEQPQPEPCVDPAFTLFCIAQLFRYSHNGAATKLVSRRATKKHGFQSGGPNNGPPRNPACAAKDVFLFLGCLHLLSAPLLVMLASTHA